MIGHWQLFGQGEPPQEGEALVFIDFSAVAMMHLWPERGGVGVLIAAIHRQGNLHEQGGLTRPIPYGMPWTSLPHPND